MKKQNKRGAILITTVILATAVALALGSFIALSVQSSRLSNSSFHFNTAMNLAEAGIEEAMSSVNNQSWTGWSAFEGNAANLTKALPTFDLGSGVTGHANVVVYGAKTSSNPRILAEGRTEGELGSSVSKQIEVRLHRRSRFATGMVAKNQVTFSGGNTAVDSYNSESALYSTGGQYDPTKKRDRGSVASSLVSAASDGVLLGNGDIWGYAATGGADIYVGPTGSVTGADTPSGTKIDSNRITKDFTANFDIETPPASGFTGVYGAVSASTDFGADGATNVYQIASLTANNSGDVFTVKGNVVMVIPGNVTIKGTINVTTGSSLVIYVAGNVDIGGNGIVNLTNRPKNVVINGTNSNEGGQTIKLHGNGILQAAVYAPNADIELKGSGSSGEASGSVIGNKIVVTGHYKFHYDESLAEMEAGKKFAVTLWREILSAGERVDF